MSFSRTVKTPVGVSWPALPVDTVVTPIRTPRRWTCMSWAPIETMIDTGAALLQLRLPDVLAGLERPHRGGGGGKPRTGEQRAAGKTGETGQRGAPGGEERFEGHRHPCRREVVAETTGILPDHIAESMAILRRRNAMEAIRVRP